MIIYKATLPNDKSYIGQSIRPPHSRRIGHKYSATHESTKDYDCYFHRAIRKYGWDNVKWEILEDNITDHNILNENETFYILKYDSYLPNGYNMDLGGTSRIGYKHSEESKRKMSMKKKGKVFTEEHKQRIKDNHADFKGNKHPQYGKHLTAEHKKIISESNKGKIISEEQINNLRTRMMNNTFSKGKIPSMETRIKMSNVRKGKKFSESHKQKMREAWILRKARKTNDK